MEWAATAGISTNRLRSTSVVAIRGPIARFRGAGSRSSGGDRQTRPGIAATRYPAARRIRRLPSPIPARRPPSHHRSHAVHAPNFPASATCPSAAYPSVYGACDFLHRRHLPLAGSSGDRLGIMNPYGRLLGESFDERSTGRGRRLTVCCKHLDPYRDEARQASACAYRKLEGSAIPAEQSRLQP